MSDCNSLNYAPTAVASSTYAHTHLKISELQGKSVRIDTPADTLKFFESTPDLRRIVDHLQKSHPVVNEQFRFRCLNGSKGTVKGLKVALLLAAGWTHEAISDYVNSSRYTITRICLNLKKEGLNFPSAPNSSKHFDQKQPTFKRDRMDTLLSSVMPRLMRNGHVSAKIRRWLIEVIWPLNWSDFRHQRRYEQRTKSIGVGSEAERKLDFLLADYSGRKLGGDKESPFEDSYKGKPAIDQLMESYWKGTLEIGKGWRKHHASCRPHKKHQNHGSP